MNLNAHQSAESGGRVGDGGYTRTQGSKPSAAADNLGHLLALRPTPADEQDRAQAGAPAAVPAATGGSIEVAWVDQGHADEKPVVVAAAHWVALVVVKLVEAKRGFVLPPRRWAVERSLAWDGRFRRPSRDDGRLPPMLEARSSSPPPA